MRIAQFQTTIHTTPHVIYHSRHGQSEYNVLGKIGGNPPLSQPGYQYSEKLAEWVPDNVCKDSKGSVVKARLWTSSLQRTIRTAEKIPHPVVSDSTIEDMETPRELVGALSEPPMGHSLSNGSLGTLGVNAQSDFIGYQPLEPEDQWQQMSPRVYRNLDEIFAGEYEGLTYDEIKQRAPDEAALRSMDKIGYRYPRGESYFDLLARLDPLVHEMESYHEPLMIVSHQATLRVLYSYLMCKPRHNLTKQAIPLHTVIRITYDGWNPPAEKHFFLGPNPDDLQADGQAKL